MSTADKTEHVEKPFSAIWRYNRRYRSAYIAGAVLSLLCIALNMATPLFIRAIVGRLLADDATWGVVWAVFGGLIAMAFLSGLALYFQRTLMTRASRKFEYDLRNDYYRHILSMDRAFHNRMPTGDIMARATNDLNYVRGVVGPGIMGSVALIRVPFTLLMLLWFSLRLTLLVFMPLPVVCVLVYFFIKYIHRQSRKVQDQFAVVTSRAHENLSGARLVKAYSLADREFDAFHEASDRYMRESRKLALFSAFAWPFIMLIFGMMGLVILGVGGGMVIDGQLPLEDLTAFMMYQFMLLEPLMHIGYVLSLYQRGSAGMKRILDIMSEKSTVTESSDVEPDAPPVAGEVRFEHVTFAYEGQPVLDDVSFTIPKGETVAVVGPTGCGKSTIVSLLMREYDPQSGGITINDIDLRDLSIATLRKTIACVPQDTFLFSQSIRDNLTIGGVMADDEALLEACEVAQFTEALDGMPEQLDSLLGERGVNLSGGQKQRLTMARAVLRDPNVLILDDAFASVDTHTEEAILRRLDEYLHARTSIIISHRVSTVQQADKIVVLSDGRIAEQGDHDTLLALDGIYAEMHRQQQLEEELKRDQ